MKILLTMALLAGCGDARGLPNLLLQGSGTSGKTEPAPDPSGLTAAIGDVRGSIASAAGSSAAMAGWVVTAFEADTGVARVAEVDSAGLFTLSHVRLDKVQTLALLNPDYILQAVLSIPDARDPKAIFQYVYFQSPTMPKLIYESPTITFENLDGLSIQKKLASSQKGNGIPDGWHLANVPDTNQDGVPNDKDPDIDGDGIVNWLDDDDNGNGILDIFDPDQNADLVNDTTSAGHNTDQWFKEGVEFIAAAVNFKPKSDGTGLQASIDFATKLRSDQTPFAVQIRGAPSLLNNSTWTTTDAAGNKISQAWDRRLNGGADVRTKEIQLKDGKSPRGHEVLFFELALGTPANPWFMDYAWTFPEVPIGAVTGQFDANTRTALLVGNPFGTIQDFVWNIEVYDDQGAVVYVSPAIAGTTRQVEVPADVMGAGGSYRFELVARSLDKVPGYPALSVHSLVYDMK